MKATQGVLTTWIGAIAVLALSGCSSVNSVKQETISTVDSLDGSSISYGVSGEGDVAVVFIHCWTCSHEFWKPQVEYFETKDRVVWLDLAGHGLSGTNRQQYTMTSFGQDVAAVVNETGAEDVVLVGHSMGGPVAIEAARLLGDRVIGIVGVDTFYTPFQYPESEEQIEAFVRPFKEDFKGTSEQMLHSMFTQDADADTVASVVELMAEPNQEMAISAMYEIFRWNIRNVPASLDMYAGKLRNINGAPTGIETPLHESVTVIPHVGHFVAQVKPDQFNKVLDGMIAEFQAR